MDIFSRKRIFESQKQYVFITRSVYDRCKTLYIVIMQPEAFKGSAYTDILRVRVYVCRLDINCADILCVSFKAKTYVATWCLVSAHFNELFKTA